jgi:PAS domain S-box-containing protein
MFKEKSQSDQHQVKALFDHATEGIILTDDKGKIVLLNPAAFRLFQYDHDELPGQSIDILIPRRFHHTHSHDREAFYQHPSNRTMGQNRDLFARKKDGTEFPVEVSLGYYTSTMRCLSSPSSWTLPSERLTSWNYSSASSSWKK